MVGTHQVWLVTGAGRGMGVDIAKAALAAGHKVVATGRNPDRVAKVLGHSENLLVVKLDVTKREDATAAAEAVISRFGRIDVLVNNAASFNAGYFEELSPDEINQQLATSLIGPMNVTRAFLPAMRAQKSGKIISISSSAGLIGYGFCSAYSAAKFGLDGWMEALQAEVAPSGIQTMTVNPGFFRTELLTDESTQFAATHIDDYSERNAQQHAFWKTQNGKQSGDPAKLAQALLKLAARDEMPRRFLAGADAIGTAEQKIAILQNEMNAFRELSSSLDFDDVELS